MENQIGSKYLPVGTVVMLKGGTKRVMITGFCVTTPEREGEVWDYMGCLYPEGVISTNTNCVFDHSQIVQVCFMGYMDEEELTFKNKLKESIAKKEASNKEG